MREREAIDRMIKFLDDYQQALDRLRQPERAERLRAIAHELAKFRIDVFGEPR